MRTKNNNLYSQISSSVLKGLGIVTVGAIVIYGLSKVDSFDHSSNEKTPVSTIDGKLNTNNAQTIDGDVTFKGNNNKLNYQARDTCYNAFKK